MKKNYVYEEWRPIKGYEELYRVSNFGRVYSLIRNKYLKPRKDKDGYLDVILSKEGEHKTFKIHRLVAIAFIPNPNNLPFINHKGEIKNKNFVWQLEWCTSKYNANYGTRLERLSKHFSKKVLQYDLNNNFIKEWDSLISIEKTLNISASNISKCCLNKKYTAYGYIWKYKQED